MHMRRPWRLLMAIGLLAGLVPLLPVGVAVAGNAVVAAPCGEAEFDAALATAQTGGGGTITFNCGGPATIIFSSQKTITSGNTVIIDGADLITLDGDDSTRLFYVNSGGSLEVRNITLTNGYEDEGGAIWNEGSLTIAQSTVSSNESYYNAGALVNEGSGTMTITDSEFFDNYSDEDGGVIDTNYGTTLTIKRSTFRDNEAYDDAGAIELDGGTVIIEDSTFDNNDAGRRRRWRDRHRWRH